MDLFRVEIVSEAAEAATLALFGHMQRVHVDEVDALLSDLAAQKRSVTLDLGSLQLLDREAACFLSRLCVGGVALRNSPPFVTRWVDQCGRQSS